MGRRFEFAKAFLFFLPLFLILLFQTEIASSASPPRNDTTENTVIASPDRGEAISESSPVPIAEVTERMHSLAQKLNHMPEPPELGAIQLPIVDIPKRNSAKTEEKK